MKSYLLLRGSGLSKERQQDYVMHAGGDLSDYEGIFVLLQRFAKQEATSHSSSIQTMSAHYVGFSRHGMVSLMIIMHGMMKHFGQMCMTRFGPTFVRIMKSELGDLPVLLCHMPLKKRIGKAKAVVAKRAVPNGIKQTNV